MTAQALAEELEVSVRTIYRDLDALSAAGVPVYAERGPGGGCALLDSYRTTLTGLTQDEVRALFMLGIPSPLAELGLDQELRSALLKLSASLPAARRQDEERTSQRIHLDSAGWFETHQPMPLLSIIQQALWADRKLWLTYRLPFETLVERPVAPYGLVAKAAVWWLICGQDEYIRVLRVSQILRAALMDEPFTRPTDFDLARFWQAWCAEVESNRPRYPVSMRVAPEIMPYLSHFFGDSIGAKHGEAEAADGEGWITLTVIFDSLEDARQRILGCGGAVEILDPPALRLSVSDFAAQTVSLYTR
jgi:predicted DNA-binding transcriptional regulator YafY